MTFELYILKNKKEMKGNNCTEMMNVGGMLSILVITCISREKGLTYWEIELER